MPDNLLIARATALMAANGFALIYLIRFLETHATPIVALLLITVPSYGLKSGYAMLHTNQDQARREAAATMTLAAMLIFWFVWRLLP